MIPPLVVLDTVVVVAAILGEPSSADARLIRAATTGEVRLAISDDFLRELTRVLSYPDITAKTRRPVRAFEVGLTLGLMGKLYHPRRLDWPSLNDPNDGWVFDLAWESGAQWVVSRDVHVLSTGRSLGFMVCTPPEAIGQMGLL